jgi:hypothetical protein
MERGTRLVRAIRTRWIVRYGGTDKRRWRRVANLDHAWSTRHELMATWIRRRDVVIDLGSGPGRFAALLPSGCQYIPVDLVSRGSGSVVRDLNREPLPDLRGDFVVMSGVLEYIHDLPRFLAGTVRLAPRAAASYACAETFSDLRARRANGWVNQCTEAELRRMLATAGWEVLEDVEGSNQHVFHLRAAGSTW